MTLSLQASIHGLVRQVLGSYEGAWLVWSDPRGDWLLLLRQAASSSALGGFTLVEVGVATAEEVGKPCVAPRPPGSTRRSGVISPVRASTTR